MARNKAKKRKFKRKPRNRKLFANAMVKMTGSGLTKSSPFGKTLKWDTRIALNQISLNPGVDGLAATHIFSLNGLFDPDITGSEPHQACGFDQMVGIMYDHYTVIAARARVSFANNDVGFAQQCILSIRDNDAPITNPDRIIENGLNRWCVVAPQGSGGDVKTLQINCSIDKFFGKKTFNDDLYRGSLTSNPSEGVFLHLTVQPVNAINTEDVRCTVEIQYIAILTEPRVLPTSV